MKQNFKFLAGITAVYLLLNIVLVRGLSGGISNNDLKSLIDETVHGQWDKTWSAISAFGVLVGSAGNAPSQTGSILQSMLIILQSLVIITSLRRLFTGSKVKIKEAYYKATDQLVPVLLTLTYYLIQLIPLLIAGVLLQALSGGFIVTTLERVVVATIFLVGFGWSVYLLSGSIFALFIVTLPDMTPLQAIRTSKKLTKFRRFQVIRKLLFLPIFVLVLLGLVIVPLILIWATLAEPVFYVMIALSIIFIYCYGYHLYRELIA